MMDSQIDRIANRVDTAREACPVADAVASAIKARLEATMSERALRPGELAALAMALLEAANNSGGEEATK